ncbi:hypothetical protein QF035_007056 [Streptomyces umbrinus]|uniref:Transposase n=1 Tax=Streptomyces umbrinus TaxID=67370 RepID=A0ABU0T0Y7_9ACTN|nr:hypothetical protein [Streptomyces umbrinus]
MKPMGRWKWVGIAEVSLNILCAPRLPVTRLDSSSTELSTIEAMQQVKELRELASMARRTKPGPARLDTVRGVWRHNQELLLSADRRCYKPFGKAGSHPLTPRGRSLTWGSSMTLQVPYGMQRCSPSMVELLHQLGLRGAKFTGSC